MAERDIWGSMRASMGVPEKDVKTVSDAVANAVEMAKGYREPIAAQARAASLAAGAGEPSLAGSVASMDNSWSMEAPNAPSAEAAAPEVQPEAEPAPDDGRGGPEI